MRGTEMNIMNKRVLVLNQTYEPLTVCRLDKAMILTLLNKADVVENYEGHYIRSATKVFEVPSIIKLNRYVHIPFKRVELNRNNIFKRDNYTCQYCDSKRDLTIDHIQPKSRGGLNIWENLVTACISCNNSKGDKTPDEAGMILKSEPHKPSYHGFMSNTIGKAEESWKQFLYI